MSIAIPYFAKKEIRQNRMELYATQFRRRGVWLLSACAHRKLPAWLQGRKSTVPPAVPSAEPGVLVEGGR